METLSVSLDIISLSWSFAPTFVLPSDSFLNYFYLYLFSSIHLHPSSYGHGQARVACLGTPVADQSLGDGGVPQTRSSITLCPRMSNFLFPHISSSTSPHHGIPKMASSRANDKGDDDETVVEQSRAQSARFSQAGHDNRQPGTFCSSCLMMAG